MKNVPGLGAKIICQLWTAANSCEDFDWLAGYRAHLLDLTLLSLTLNNAFKYRSINFKQKILSYIKIVRTFHLKSLSSTGQR